MSRVDLLDPVHSPRPEGDSVVAWLATRWSLLAQVHALESTSGVAALRRSRQLVRGNWWRVASLLLFLTFLALVVGLLCGTLLLFVTPASFDFINLVAGAVNAIVLPYAAVATTYLYFDLRVEKESEPGDEDVLLAETPTLAAGS